MNDEPMFRYLKNIYIYTDINTHYKYRYIIYTYMYKDINVCTYIYIYCFCLQVSNWEESKHPLFGLVLFWPF